MARSFIQPGDVMTFTAPYPLLAGQGFQVGGLFAVAQHYATTGSDVEGMVCGVHGGLDKADAQAWAHHEPIYWDNTARVCTTTALNNTLIGSAAEAVAATPGLVTGAVRLNGAAAAPSA